MPDPEIRRDIEAVLFAAGRPVTPDELRSAVSHTREVEMREVEDALTALTADYPLGGGRGIELAWMAGGWTLRTNRAASSALTVYFDREVETKLTPAAVEVLAIIAYLQPVSRPEINEIRGVNSDSTVQRLVERDLIEEAGRSDGPGAAILYGTTRRFEIMFGLAGLQSLPPLEEFNLSAEDHEELRRRLGISRSPE